MVTYSHAGDLGDLLAALPTIAQLGAGHLVLYPTANMVREPWTEQKAERVKSFLEAQEYITGVTYEPEPRGVILDEWRKRYNRRLNLSDMVADAFNVPRWPTATPWCKAERLETPPARYVFHRSPRYQDRMFPWRNIVERYGEEAVFVGSPAEYQMFIDRFGGIRYHHTPTLLDLARAVASCEAFIGNQSAPRWLAESLKVRVWVEEWRPRNTHFDRPNAHYGRQWPQFWV